MSPTPSVPSTARAAVFVGPGQPLELRAFPVPDLRTGEVLVRVLCTTLCGSDLHTYHGRRPAPGPIVLGHEILGAVEAFGPGAPARDLAGRPLEVGDRVTWAIIVHCRECFFCRRGLPQKCERLFKYGHEPVDRGHPLSGGLAERCHLLAGTSIVRVPDGVPDRIACPASCATATVVAALRAGGGCQDDVVLVQGLGALGLTACAMAKTRGAARVVATDVDPERLALAHRFGADDTFDARTGEGELREAIAALTDGRGADLALELSGAPKAIESALPLLRTGGRHVWVGSVAPTRPVHLDPETVVRRLLLVVGVHNYAPQDLAAAVAFLADTDLPFEALTPATFSLAAADSAFREEERHLRALLVP